MSNDITTNTNLLSSSAFKKFQQTETPQQTSPVTTPVVQQQPSPQIQPQPQVDTFNQKTLNGAQKSSFAQVAEKYSGPAALLLSVIGLPVVYTQAKKSNAKAAKTMQTLVDEVKNLNIEKKIEEAVSKINLPKPEAGGSASAGNNAFPASTVLTSLFVGIGSALGINEFVKNNKEKSPKI